MHKHIRATFTADEAKTLGVVEPFDCTYFTIRHDSLRSNPDSETNRPQRADGLLSMTRSGDDGGFRKSAPGTHVAKQTQWPKHSGFYE